MILKYFLFQNLLQIPMGRARNHGGTGGHGCLPLPGERPNFNRHVMSDKDLLYLVTNKNRNKLSEHQPDVQKATSVNLSGSQVKLSGTQVKLSGTPVQLSGTPVKLPDTPVKLTGASVKHPGIPVKLPMSPVKLSGTPIKLPGTKDKLSGT